MRTIFIFGILAFICSVSLAQKKMDDVVLLKNGSKIKGTIHQIIPDSIVNIEQADGSVWVFKMNETAMIYKEETTHIKMARRQEHSLTSDTIATVSAQKTKALISGDRGYRFSLDAGILMGLSEKQEKSVLNIQMLHSYQIIASTSVGLGAGFEFFNTTQAPVFIDLRHYFNRKYYAPFLFAQGGAMLPIGKGNPDNYGYTYKGKPGYMVKTGVGFLFPVTEKTDLSISFSYKYMELKFTRDESHLVDYERIEKTNLFNLQIGLILR